MTAADAQLLTTLVTLTVVLHRRQHCREPDGQQDKALAYRQQLQGGYEELWARASQPQRTWLWQFTEWLEQVGLPE